MSETYTKLFSSITESTIWSEPAGTRLVWITMLAKCNRHGEVLASVPGLARLANVTLEECEAALATLTAPDKYSRTPDHEGRRIEVIDRGWRLLNHGKFDRMRSEIEAQERDAERKRAWDRANRANRPNASYRDRITPDVPPTTPDVPPTQSDAPADVAVTAAKETAHFVGEGDRKPSRAPAGDAAPRPASEQKQETPAPGMTRAGAVGRALASGGVLAARINHYRPDFIAVVESDVTTAEIEATARELVAIGKKDVTYILRTIIGRRADAAANPPVAVSAKPASKPRQGGSPRVPETPKTRHDDAVKYAATMLLYGAIDQAEHDRQVREAGERLARAGPDASLPIKPRQQSAEARTE